MKDNPDLKFLSYYCDNEFRTLVYNNIISKEKTFETLKSIITDGIIQADLTDFNTSLKCENVFEEYRAEIAEELYIYANNDVYVDQFFTNFNKHDPLCYTTKNKQIVVFFCIIMIVSEWLSVYTNTRVESFAIKDFAIKETIEQ